MIDMGFSALAIAERVGHESIDITYRYAHLFPTRQTEMADKLDLEYDCVVSAVFQSKQLYDEHKPVSVFYQNVEREGLRVG